MSEAMTADAAAPRELPRRALLPARRRNVALLLFVTASLLVSMSVIQEEAPEPGSITYWLLVLPAALLPLADAGVIVKTLTGRVWMLLLFLATAGAWHVAAGDTRAVIQLGLLVWVLAWISSDRARLAIDDLVALYATLVALGLLVYLFTGLNKWGPLPGLTVEDYGVWRVSFFPNIAYTAFLSLAVVLVLTRDMKTLRRYPLAFAVALYFLVFSFVRTALVAFAVYALLRWWFARRRTPGRLFWSALLLGFGVNAAIAGSVVVLDFLQQYPLTSRLLLRGESELSTEEIFQQLYRPWLWWQHMQQFASSPFLMGWGAFNFDSMKIDALVEGQEQGDTVSLPTRLLASYGVPGLLFTLFLVSQLRRLSRRRDAWACACFAAIFLLIMQWGSVFHPSDALFSIFLMMIVGGSSAYTERRHSAPSPVPGTP